MHRRLYFAPIPKTIWFTAAAFMLWTLSFPVVADYRSDDRYRPLKDNRAERAIEKLAAAAGISCSQVKSVAVYSPNNTRQLTQYKFMCDGRVYQLTHWTTGLDGPEVIFDKHTGSIEPSRRIFERQGVNFDGLRAVEARFPDTKR